MKDGKIMFYNPYLCYMKKVVCKNPFRDDRDSRKGKIILVFSVFLILLIAWSGEGLASPNNKNVVELNQIARKNVSIAPDVALQYAIEAVEQSKNQNDQQNHATGLLNMGLAYLQKGDKSNAGRFLEESLSVARQGMFAKEEGDASNFLGTHYLEEGMCDQAMKNYLKALDIRTALGDRIGMSKTINNLGLVNAKIGNYDKALEFYRESLAMKGGEDLSGRSNTLINMGITYKEKEEYENALKVMNQALAIATENGFIQGQAFARRSMAEVQGLLGEYHVALENLQKAMSLYEKVSYRRGVALSLYRMGLIYEQMGQNKSALEYYLKAVPVADETGQKKMIRDIYYRCARVSKDSREKDEALLYYEKYANMEEVVLNEEMHYRIMIQQTQYEVDLQEREIELLKHQAQSQELAMDSQKKVLIVIAVGLCICSIGIVYLRQQVVSKLKKERELLAVTAQLEKANEQLNQLAETDFLTKLSNRRFFDERFTVGYCQELNRWKNMSVIMADIDFFKAYNDLYGHQQGDKCLVQVASALQNILSGTDHLLARYGGEEFIIVVSMGSEKNIEIAELLRQGIEDLNIPHQGSAFGMITCSFGIASCKEMNQRDTASLVTIADQALYRAKKAGRNRVSIA